VRLTGTVACSRSASTMTRSTTGHKASTSNAYSPPSNRISDPARAGNSRDVTLPPAAAASYSPNMTVIRSISLFIVAAVAEIGGAYLVWQGVRQRRGFLFVLAGVVALGLYGFFATFQPSAHFGRILAAYGGVFVAGSLAWGIVFNGFRPDRYDLIGAAICLIGVTVIMYAPRGSLN
jgi:small multidrug resistance family-3 protein